MYETSLSLKLNQKSLYFLPRYLFVFPLACRMGVISFKRSKADFTVGNIYFFYKETYIDLGTVFDAILTSRQTREKLQCLYKNPMSNNFHKTAVLEKI